MPKNMTSVRPDQVVAGTGILDPRRTLSDLMPRGLNWRVMTQTGDVDAGESILADGTNRSVDVNLPDADKVGLTITVKRKDASGNTVRVCGRKHQTIDGAATYSLAAQYKWVTVSPYKSDAHAAAQWLIVAAG